MTAHATISPHEAADRLAVRELFTETRPSTP